jgi:hypothetical protein
VLSQAANNIRAMLLTNRELVPSMPIRCASIEPRTC